jgi:hypothetical protein
VPFSHLVPQQVPSVTFLSPSHPHLVAKGLPTQGKGSGKGRAAGPGTARHQAAGRTCCSGFRSCLRQRFRSGQSARSLESGLGRFRAAKFCPPMGWKVEGGPKSGKQGRQSRCDCLLRWIQHLPSACGAQSQAWASAGLGRLAGRLSETGSCLGAL